ncbi:DUF3857 domain-containing protein [Segatella copri]|jgi:hypothetical protein|uniref:DUF3857 domain-containing protein n=1 Tax=Segatella copri TaxID=165179 RepID=UPI0020CCC9F8|nr:DUF3857 domain-containing protein [Segatella copri]MCP9457034.1 DUF3857 domain-containing protein [Segatella copri]MCP9505533.1 DUF3857 domain-containing protein [Segatella copri]MCP9517418.1 DUF3857 domain-containing protein [Segatella copri]MCP9520616.1 DUF3857 domain-containing protein [Segatella copri]MCP9527210.1 DUF3857 domain-containing protein [Segatella copri]
MGKIKVIRVVFSILLVQLFTLSVNADEKADYLKLAQKVRQEVWSSTPADFQKRTVPDRYKNASAVILSYYRELSTDYYRKATADLVLNLRLTRQIDCTDMERMLIQINDKKALKDYSEFTFKTKSRKWTWGYHHKTQTVLGIRVIKKNGNVQEVSLDDYVDVKEGKNDKDLSQKIAVPGLEVGDCIDVFSLDQIDTQEQQLDPFYFVLRQDEPVLYTKVHCVLDQSLATVYRTMNGAPDFTQTTDKDKNAVLDMVMDKPVDAESSIWYNSLEQSPFIEMYITPTKAKVAVVEKAMRQKGVRGNPDVTPILQDDWKLLKSYVSKGGYSPAGLPSTYKSVFKSAKKEGMSAEEKADRIYSFEYVSGGASQRVFNTVANYLRKLGVEIEMGITTPFGALPVDKLINYNSTSWFFRLKGTDVYYFPGTYPKVASEIPYIYQGRKAYMQDSEEQITIPVSQAEDNKSVNDMVVKLDGTKLDIIRKVTYSGEQKMYGQSLVSPDNTLFGSSQLEAYWRYLKYDDKDPYSCYTKKESAELKGAFNEYRKNAIDPFKAEISSYHDGDPVQVGGYGVDCVGIRRDSSNFVYHVDYVMDGMVKRAGNNYLLSVGKLIGSSLKLEGKDRERIDDVWRKMAFVDEWNIEIPLPQGYKVSAEALKKIETSVANECGEFTVKATAGNESVKVYVRKCFAHRVEPVSNWSKLLALVDACSAFADKQMVIAK